MGLEWARMMRGARTLMDDCASVRPGEQVLVVTDTRLVEIGRVLIAAAYERGAEPVLAVIRLRDADGQEPPPVVAEAMRAADVVFAPVSRSITHTRAVKEAAGAGARILVMTAFTERLMISGGILPGPEAGLREAGRAIHRGVGGPADDARWDGPDDERRGEAG